MTADVLTALSMSGEQKPRETWTARINLRPLARSLISRAAYEDKLSMATAIGIAIETYVDARFPEVTRSSTS